MSSLTGTTTLVCLFHSDGHAKAAIDDLKKVGIPESSILRVSGEPDLTTHRGTFENLGVREADSEHLRKGLEDGGTVIVVSAAGEHSDAVERIFHEHEAVKVEDSDIDEDGNATAPHDRELTEPRTAPRIYHRTL